MGGRAGMRAGTRWQRGRRMTADWLADEEVLLPARALLDRTLERLEEEDGPPLAGRLREYYGSLSSVAPPPVERLMQWGFSPARALKEAGDWLSGTAPSAIAREEGAGREVRELLAQAEDALAERLREAYSRIRSHPAARTHDAMAGLLAGVGDEQPELLPLTAALAEFYALGARARGADEARLDVLRAPEPEYLAVPRFAAFHLVQIAAWNTQIFGDTATAIESRAGRVFNFLVDPSGIGARSARELVDQLRTCDRELLSPRVDPGAEAWEEVAAALGGLAGPAASSDGPAPAGTGERSAALAGLCLDHYHRGIRDPGTRAAGPPTAPGLVVAARLDPEALSRLRTALAATIPEDARASVRSVALDLDARLGAAEAMLREPGAWGVAVAGEPPAATRHRSACRRVAGRIRAAVAAAEDFRSLPLESRGIAEWLAIGYENMARAPRLERIEPPSLAEIGRMEWTPGALRKLARQLARAGESQTRARARTAGGSGAVAPAELAELLTRVRAAARRPKAERRAASGGEGGPAEVHVAIGDAAPDPGPAETRAALLYIRTALGDLDEGDQSLLSGALRRHYDRPVPLEPPSVETLMQWGFYPADDLETIADWLDGSAAEPLQAAGDGGKEGASLAASGFRALAGRMREARSRLGEHPAARAHDLLARSVGAVARREPETEVLAATLEAHYAIDMEPDASFAARQSVLGGPLPERIDPPRFEPIDLIAVSEGDPDAFARLADALEGEAGGLLAGEDDPAGVARRSAEALAAMLRECGETLLGVASDPDARPWFEVLGALSAPLIERGSDDPAFAEDAFQPDEDPVENLRAVLTLYYMQRTVRPELRDDGPPPLRAVVAGAFLDPGAIAGLRAEIAEAEREGPGAGGPVGDLVARLAEAEELLGDASTWGLHRPGPAGDGPGAEPCRRVAGRLIEIMDAMGTDDISDEGFLLISWLFVGYEHMASWPPARPVAPPSVRDVARLGWSREALVALADVLEGPGGNRAERRRRRRGQASGIHELAESLRRAAARAP